MTFLGKIFTGLIAALSISFLMLAIMVTATHKNWREIALDPSSGLKVQVETKQRDIENLKTALEEIQVKLAQEKAARRTALAALETQKKELDIALRASQKDVQDLQSSMTVIDQEIKTKVDDLDRISLENAELRKQIIAEREERDELFLETARVSDELSATKGLLAEQEERAAQLVIQNTRYKEVLTYHDIKPEDPITNTPPNRNGVILVVNHPKRLVEISIGYDEGLRKGHFLDVTRGPRYLGRLKVIKTEPNRSVAEILKDHETGLMRMNDRVDTSIK